MFSSDIISRNGNNKPIPKTSIDIPINSKNMRTRILFFSFLLSRLKNLLNGFNINFRVIF